MLVDTGNHHSITSENYTLSLKHYKWVQREIETLEHVGIIERSTSTIEITSSYSPQEKCTRQTTKKENVCRLQENKQTPARSNQSRRRKRMHIPHTPSKNRCIVCKTQRLQIFLKFGSKIGILPHWSIRLSKAQVSICAIISQQITVQQSSIWFSTNTSTLPETDQ